MSIYRTFIVTFTKLPWSMCSLPKTFRKMQLSDPQINSLSLGFLFLFLRRFMIRCHLRGREVRPTDFRSLGYGLKLGFSFKFLEKLRFLCNKKRVTSGARTQNLTSPVHWPQDPQKRTEFKNSDSFESYEPPRSTFGSHCMLLLRTYPKALLNPRIYRSILGFTVRRTFTVTHTLFH